MRRSLWKASFSVSTYFILIVLVYHMRCINYTKLMIEKITVGRKNEFVLQELLNVSISTTNDINLNSTTETSGEGTKEELGTRQKRKKPYLVLHVGPPKTATTSLQTDLTRIKDILLAEDNYIYAGRYYSPFVDERGRVRANRTQTELNHMIRRMWITWFCKQARKPDRSVCVHKFRNELEKYKGHNVLISDEAISGQFIQEPANYAAMAEVLQDDWEIVIVVSYRRFFQWLPSNIFQYWRMDGAKDRISEWPGVVGSKKGKKGKEVELAFPNVYKNWFDHGHRFTDFVLHNVNKTFPVKIFNFHEGSGSMVSRFVCNMLPDAPKTCEKTLEMDRKNKNKTVMNEASSVIHVSYDMLTTRAGELGLIDKSRFQRKTVREEFHKFTRVELGRTHLDFDQTCPETFQLEEFLNMSLALEEEVLGKETAATMEADSRAAYWADVEKGRFCQVDINATLRKEPWKSFFSQYAPTQP